MLHHAEAGHLEPALQLAERLAVALEELVEEMAAGRVGQGPEHRVAIWSVCHSFNMQVITCISQEGEWEGWVAR